MEEDFPSEKIEPGLMGAFVVERRSLPIEVD